eukprot:363958-Chlamydomonas_euryale.AAC.6
MKIVNLIHGRALLQLRNAVLRGLFLPPPHDGQIQILPWTVGGVPTVLGGVADGSRCRRPSRCGRATGRATRSPNRRKGPATVWQRALDDELRPTGRRPSPGRIGGRVGGPQNSSACCVLFADKFAAVAGTRTKGLRAGVDEAQRPRFDSNTGGRYDVTGGTTFRNGSSCAAIPAAVLPQHVQRGAVI